MNLSVIIPTRNRCKTLARALDSITKQTISSEEFEVIVVDNGSEDATEKTVKGFKSKLSNLKYIYDANPGLHIGRHRGLFAAEGEILVFADDDIYAFNTWLEGVKESFDDNDVVLVGGKNLPDYQISPPEWITERWNEWNTIGKYITYLSILDLGDETKKINPYYVFGCNYAIRKKILLEAGGFHPDGMPKELLRYRGDGESHVSKYIQKKSNQYVTLYNPKASVYHLVSEDRMTREYFIKRAYRQGISDSYTAIREGGSRFGYYLKKVKFAAQNLLGNKNLDLLIKKKYFEGYRYHQREAEDEILQDWINRNNYFGEKGTINGSAYQSRGEATGYHPSNGI